jgi:DNA-binding transcriptional ArsR family regulator
MLDSPTPSEGEGSEERDIAADKLVHALSHPMRIKLMELLERQVASSAMLIEQIGDDVSLSYVSYHLGVLHDAGCLEPLGGTPDQGEAEIRYQAAPGRALEPDFETRVGVAKVREDELLDWREIIVDRVGQAQVLEVLRSARLQLIEVESQSEQRLAMTGDARSVLMVGAVAIKAPSGQDGPSQ